MKKDITILVTAALSALLLFLATVGVSFEWFTLNSINAFEVLLGALVTLGATLYGIYKNTHIITERARKQKEELKRRNLL